MTETRDGIAMDEIHRDGHSNNSKPPEIQWPPTKVHRVLQCYRNVKPEAYTPVVVSFGPYHNGVDHLRSMDEHKKRVYSDFRIFFIKLEQQELINKRSAQLRAKVLELFDERDPQFARIEKALQQFPEYPHIWVKHLDKWGLQLARIRDTLQLCHEYPHIWVEQLDERDPLFAPIRNADKFFFWEGRNPQFARNIEVLEQFLEYPGIRVVHEQVAWSIEELEQCYLGPGNRDDFSRLMVEDGLFLIALLDACARTTDFVSPRPGGIFRGGGLQFPPGDPVFGDKAREYLWPYIRRDLLLVDNQIPLKFLETLLETRDHWWAPMQQGETTGQRLRMLILLYFGPPHGCSDDAPFIMPNEHYILDVYRNSFLRQDGQQDHIVNLPISEDMIVDRAKDLWLSGVAIKQEIQQSNLLQILVEERSGGEKIYHIPKLALDDITESILLNLLALERLDEGTDNKVSTFVKSMIALVLTPFDCRILRVGYNVSLSPVSDEAVSNFFQKVANALYPEPQLVLDSHKGKPKKPLCFRVVNNIWRYLRLLFIEDMGRALTFISVFIALFGLWLKKNSTYIYFYTRQSTRFIGNIYIPSTTCVSPSINIMSSSITFF